MAGLTLLRAAIGANVVYFVAMAFAHFNGLKYPILFIYYDVPFHAYQDKIISFCALTYAILFTAAFNHPDVMLKYALASLAVTVAGLSAVNMSDALAEVLPPGASTSAYWAQTGMIASIGIVLFALSRGAAHGKSTSTRKRE